MRTNLIRKLIAVGAAMAAVTGASLVATKPAAAAEVVNGWRCYPKWSTSDSWSEGFCDKTTSTDRYYYVQVTCTNGVTRNGPIRVDTSLSGSIPPLSRATCPTNTFWVTAKIISWPY